MCVCVCGLWCCNKPLSQCCMLSIYRTLVCCSDCVWFYHRVMVAVTGGVSLITAFCLFSLVVWPIKIRRCEFKKKKVGGANVWFYNCVILLPDRFHGVIVSVLFCVCLTSAHVCSRLRTSYQRAAILVNRWSITLMMSFSKTLISSVLKWRPLRRRSKIYR